MNKFDLLQEKVIELAKYAKEKQLDISYSFKSDGTIVTKVDLFISNSLIQFISEHFPDSSIISEEAQTNTIKDGKYIFIIDPIDGTEIYSQGLPSYCISIGILDGKSRSAIGAFIAAPRFGIYTDSLFFRLDPIDNKLYYNGSLYKPLDKSDKIYNIAVGSSAEKLLDLSNKTHKIRSFGSNILHMIMPVICDRINACFSPSCYVWDVASAVAILEHIGFATLYKDGSKFIFNDDLLLLRKKFSAPLYSGSPYLAPYALSLVK